MIVEISMLIVKNEDPVKCGVKAGKLGYDCNYDSEYTNFESNIYFFKSDDIKKVEEALEESMSIDDFIRDFSYCASGYQMTLEEYNAEVEEFGKENVDAYVIEYPNREYHFLIKDALPECGQLEKVIIRMEVI